MHEHVACYLTTWKNRALCSKIRFSTGGDHYVQRAVISTLRYEVLPNLRSAKLKAVIQNGLILFHWVQQFPKMPH